MLTSSLNRSALDFNPINTIASHMSYWQDEDVSHFIISQLLSRKKEDEKQKGDLQVPLRI
ncbi:uncharacterized protein F4812DRAFT_427965 [Daldinia caldariorum]|uniref:uncharacterized protein n=1 Tax=Daldinia caldariorum TaxID=326644 RepID=UPI00200837B2|nr:uncharacterized protein F4812DRAFT_427965 [Daldinia caldariorum]KAI1467878.1 hypothetical protein F4812DRAFT_427965 [Daldinia caldariorum]